MTSKEVAVKPPAAPGLPTVVVNNVSMRYKVPSTDRAAQRSGSKLTNVAHRILGKQPEVVVRAVSNITFVARAGESIGLVGRNGSGKSTMLRMIAGLETPTSGEVRATSTPVLLGVNAALIPDLSGTQNVRLGLLAMGKTPEEVKALSPQIVELAGLGESIHLPMKSYSSGMGSRLRFAIAAAADPEILLIDEALATGDASFKARSERRMNELLRGAGTVFLVSHAAQTIEETCTRAIWIDRGKMIADGPAREVARAYRLWAWKIAQGEDKEAERLYNEALDEFRSVQVEFVEPQANPDQLPRHGRRL